MCAHVWRTAATSLRTKLRSLLTFAMFAAMDSKVKPHKGAVKVIESSLFCDHFQEANLLTAVKTPSGVVPSTTKAIQWTPATGCPMKWLLVIKDHFTQLVCLCPLPLKQPSGLHKSSISTFCPQPDARLFTRATMATKKQPCNKTKKPKSQLFPLVLNHCQFLCVQTTSLHEM